MIFDKIFENRHISGTVFDQSYQIAAFLAAFLRERERLLVAGGTFWLQILQVHQPAVQIESVVIWISIQIVHDIVQIANIVVEVNCDWKNSKLTIFFFSDFNFAAKIIVLLDRLFLEFWFCCNLNSIAFLMTVRWQLCLIASISLSLHMGLKSVGSMSKDWHWINQIALITSNEITMKVYKRLWKWFRDLLRVWCEDQEIFF